MPEHRTAAEAVGCGGKPQRLIVASDWRSVERNTLRGFFSLKLPSGLVLRECSLHEQGEKRWVGLPGKPQLDEDGRQRIGADGKKLYTPIVELSRERREAFQVAALAAVDRCSGVRHERHRHNSCHR
jgi:hypothetical protein